MKLFTGPNNIKSNKLKSYKTNSTNKRLTEPVPLDINGTKVPCSKKAKYLKKTRSKDL